MNVIAIEKTDGTEPVWTDVGWHKCDFRPHFNGHLHSLFTTLHPLPTKSETEQLFRRIAIEMAKWLILNRLLSGQGDRFQMIVGWPINVRPTGRQVIKTGGDRDAIQRLIDEPDLIQLREGWCEALFPSAD